MDNTMVWGGQEYFDIWIVSAEPLFRLTTGSSTGCFIINFKKIKTPKEKKILLKTDSLEK